MKLLSLFTGAGGFDLGACGGFACLKGSINENMFPHWIESNQGDFITLAPTGFKTVFACDIEKKAKRVWDNYFLAKDGHEGDLYQVKSVVDLVNEHNEHGDVFPQDIDLLIGGFPCQDFATCGLRNGFNSKVSHTGITGAQNEADINRGTLYRSMRQVIQITKPKAFIAENVSALSSLGDALNIIKQDFAAAGYLVFTKVLYAPNYGVPQMRKRLFFIGLNKSALCNEALEQLTKDNIISSYEPFPPPTHGEGLKPFTTSLDAFVGLKEPEDSDDLEQATYSKQIFSLKQNQGSEETKLNGPGYTVIKSNVHFRRRSPEHGGINEPWLKERRLSVRESARLQTFPDDFKWILPKDDQGVGVSMYPAYQMLGNAVPPVLAYNIVQNLKSKWPLYFNNSKP